MDSNIQSLPTEVVNLIAAGEVIDSLAAVVRELVENALDAEATRIAIGAWGEQWRIRVSDNGKDMSLSDLQQAALPHSTSKIRGSQDLWQINSLGFRGEALHSLAQLAHLEICSRQPGTPEGWRVSYNARGEPAQVETVAMAPGTIVTISDLFENWLPRRQALSAPQQLRSIQLTIQHLALCHPHVTWQVQQNDRDWFSIWAGTSARQILPQLLREVQPGDLQEVKWAGGGQPGKWGDEQRGVKSQPPAASQALAPKTQSVSSSVPLLYLLLGLPDRCHRYRPDWVKVAVNGRIVKAPALEQAILAGFRRTLPRDRYPVCFLHLQIPPQQVDWNRHPAKSEIYLRHAETLQQHITEAIAQALHQSPAHLPESAYLTRVGALIKAAEAQGSYGAEESSSQGQDKNEEDNVDEHADGHADEQGSSPSLPISRSVSLPLKAIAQVHSMYILAEHPTGIWLVEQHIAHERVLYEQLCDRWQLVPLEPPIILNRLTTAQLEQLQRIGVSVEAFGEQLWAVRSAPESLAKRQDCAEALLELSLGGDLEAALVATACRTAIRNGTPLSLQAMQLLLDQWQHTRNPRTCPHGRPIYLPMEESSLSRFFRRHWVIGKSHGI